MLKRWLSNEPKVTLVCALLSAVSLVLSITGALSSLPVDPAWLAILLSGAPILIGAFRGVIFEHDVKADLLVSLALIASAATGEFFAAGEVALIMQIGSLLEDYTSEKARKSIEKLIRITPQTARVIRDGKPTVIPVEQVRVGDTLSVLAGEVIPVDGVILSGEPSIDQSVMTGESVSVDKKPGDTVMSGTLNQFGPFTLTASSVGADSSLQRMVRLAQEAEENKAPIVTAADKWATWLVGIALLCALAAWALTGEFQRAVTVLVVFCPCAFILATPTAVLAGIGNAARRGIIVRSGEALEKLSRIKQVAFDKTGTLTQGTPSVTSAVSVHPAYTDSDILRLTALAEQQSEHPLGRAVRDAWAEHGGSFQTVTGFKVHAGQGVSAFFEGHELLAGKPDFIASQSIDPAPALTAAKAELDKGATAILLTVDGALSGVITLRDVIRPDSAKAVSRLTSMGISSILLTGDSESAAQAVAQAAGIRHVRANVLPQEKMAAVRALSSPQSPLCMVGDGVNDALALSAADAGVAMGGIGSDIAIESADAVLVSDEIERLPYLLSLSRRVMKKIRINIIASLIINLTAVLFSALGILSPVTGALWHNCGSVFVVVNAALLLREKSE